MRPSALDPSAQSAMSNEPISTSDKNSRRPAWRDIVTKYQKSALWSAVWQLVNSLVPYAALWYLMYLLVPISFWFALPLAVLAGGFLVRLFIIFHDCGHGSFLSSRKANDIVGFITGVLTMTPYRQWTREHAVHHATSGDLDRRGTGDVWTLTVQEYLEASRWKRFAYRLARNPFIFFGFGPLFIFLFKNRFVGSSSGPRERRSVAWTNLGVLLFGVALSLALGWKAYLALQLVAIFVAGAAGVWLFYVQHQFEDVHWERGPEWDYASAALKGSSFYKLPKILQWFSGNIGFHHIHHLSPAIPNYHLEKCHRSEPLFQDVKPITLLSSFKSLTYRLWDEQRQKLVGYRAVRLLQKERKQAARIAASFTPVS